MTRWNSLNRREFLSTALGAAASFSVLPTGHRLIRELPAKRIGSALTLTAQAGKVYYFRTQV
jgi:hypothetical protein